MDVEETEIIELESNRYIQLETYRQWPKLGVLWSVRQRAGESDFPLHRGSEERMPDSGLSAEQVWEELRDSALTAAREAAQSGSLQSSEGKRTSFLGRLFGRS